jgi:hypothetical protein
MGQQLPMSGGCGLELALLLSLSVGCLRQFECNLPMPMGWSDLRACRKRRMMVSSGI